MDDKTALHTAARRYCEHRFSEWFQNYKDLQTREKWQVQRLFGPGWGYSDEAYRTFPHYRLDKEVQVEVEKLTPTSTMNLDELRVQLLHACDVVEARLHAELQNAFAREALRDEANDYRAYIQVLSPNDLKTIEPLPYRRVLNEQESKRLWSQLKLSWGIGGGHWFPLKEGPVPPHVMAFHDDYFERMEGLMILREALKARKIEKVYQLQEFGPPEPEYEIELSIFEPACGSGGEQYSTSESTDWLVYASHESSITICGEWLTHVFARAWPAWSMRTYLGPFSTPDLRGSWNSGHSSDAS
jgi:hypothetical protein